MGYLEQKLTEEKVFKDPIHHYIHVRDQVIWDLIGSKEFQRLRRVRQLGTSYLTFHGAEHSRFTHSLGVYEIVRKIMDEGMQELFQKNQKNRILALVAALLHDVGHGPFSHSFERAFHFHHEDFTKRIILGETEVNAILRRVDPDFPKEVTQIIDHTHPNKLIVSMISSQIDADRMDYLLRDAYYTGVSYGTFDIGRILRVMRPHQQSIVFKRSGMHAIEDYLMSRYQMYWQVYFHPVTRSGEAILFKLLERVKELMHVNYQFKVDPVRIKPFFQEEIPIADYLHLDDHVFFYYTKEWTEESDPILRDLAIRFIDRRLLQYIPFDPEKDEQKYQRLIELCTSVGINPQYYVIKDVFSDHMYEYQENSASISGAILLEDSDGTLTEVSKVSRVLQSLSQISLQSSSLYFPADLMNQREIPKSIREEFTQLLGRMDLLERE